MRASLDLDRKAVKYPGFAQVLLIKVPENSGFRILMRQLEKNGLRCSFPVFYRAQYAVFVGVNELHRAGYCGGIGTAVRVQGR